MKRTHAAVLGTLILSASSDLGTEYRLDRVLVTETTLTLSTRVTDSEILIDGEPPEDNRFGGGDESATFEVHHIIADQVLAGEDGLPTKVRREFRELGGNRSGAQQEEQRELSSPLEGVSLELLAEDGEVSATVVDGEAQDEAQLQGHRMNLAVDALLPGEEVTEGDSWDLDQDMIHTALGLTLHSVLFPQPEREAGRARPDGGGDRRGQRGARQGGGLQELSQISWEGTAEWKGAQEYEGESCYLIELELEGSGELPEREGRRGRDRALTPGSSPLWIATDLEVELEGLILVSQDGNHPVRLMLEGESTRNLERSMDRGDRQIEISRTTEGKFKLEVSISTEAAE